jgi:lysophospholipase L1-like esterase
MSIFSRLRAFLLASCVVAAGALGTLVLAPTASANKVGSAYLAVGDSLTYGFHEGQFNKELHAYEHGEAGPPNPANYEEGFVNDFADVLKIFHPSLQVINDGCPGETTETAINGAGPGLEAYCAGGPTGSPFPRAWLHHPYTGKSQLADALNVLETNHNVSPITVDLGANDVLQFLEHTCGFPLMYTCTEGAVAAEYGHIAANVYYILGQLRAAAPSAQIIVVGNYNPYPTILPPPGGDKSLALLNEALASVTKKIPGETSFTSVEPFFNAPGYFGGAAKEAGDIPTICAFTAMCPGGTFNPASPEADIHPTKLGYGVMAGVITADFAVH